MTLFERVFGGNDAVYGLTEGAIDAAIAQHGEEKAISFPNTAYALPCYYAVTGTKVTNLKELKEALGVVKSLMTRENKLNDVFMSAGNSDLFPEMGECLLSGEKKKRFPLQAGRGIFCVLQGMGAGMKGKERAL